MTREEAIKKLEVLTIMPWNIPELLEALDMAIEALQAEPTHGRLIDADALIDKLPKEYLGSTIHLLINDAPTVSVVDITQRDLCKDINCEDCPFMQETCKLMDYVAYADRPHGEWVEVVERTEQYDREGVKTWATLYQCSNCGFVRNAIEGHIGQYDFCPNCGADMRKEAEVVHKPDYSYEADMARRLREETLKNKLQELAQSDDYEMAHREADELLCDFITKLGYGEVAQKFDAVPKWYA